MARYQQIKSAAIAAAGAGDNTVVAGVTGKKIRVLGYILMASAAVNAKWRSATTDKTGLLYPGANGGASAPVVSDPSEMFWFETAVGEALVINLSGAIAVGGHVVYNEV